VFKTLKRKPIKKDEHISSLKLHLVRTGRYHKKIPFMEEKIAHFFKEWKTENP